MSIDLKLMTNANFQLEYDHLKNDLSIENGDIELVSDGEEVAQAFTIYLRTKQGENKMDLGAGLDWDTFYSVQTSMAEKEIILMDLINRTPGVKKINKFDLKIHKPTMTLFIEMNVDTVYAPNIEITMAV